MGKSQLERITRMQTETRKFVAEQHLRALNESKAWPIIVGGIFVGAALFGTGMAFAWLQ